MSAVKMYVRLQKYPELFTASKGWLQKWLDPSFLEAMHQLCSGRKERLLDLVQEEAPGIYSFPIFQPEFCKMFLEEIDNYYASGLPIRRPNSMNNYGLIVNEIGLSDTMTILQQHFLLPVAQLLFPREGAEFHDHHSFIVKYKEGEDLGLDMHTDDSDVTFNICLGRDFTGAGLTFCGVMGTPAHRKATHKYQHVVGRALVHLGAQRHGADDIESGERNNLIIWNHNHTFRESPAYRRRLYQKEDGPPDLVCLSYTHDRDYGAYKDYPEGKEDYREKGWCPPPRFCYDQMEPVETLRERMGGDRERRGADQANHQDETAAAAKTRRQQSMVDRGRQW
eukprot:CAMPEP_0177578138 /NCGR_PEP_ID=MMETSP0419_2-20121207/175_1 /TAXON_ID=582737 /ORGANISM="Tetraselmis sp., Strain GSL018" /LENGTH=336 /DNA_ID=CAMNT_0019066535 /DNA_START=114 /DNA_END=1125 /DNA_ORIENTATION=+